MSARRAAPAGRRTSSTALLGRLGHSWMARAACTHRPDLPWTEDAHRVGAELRAAMTRVCGVCPVLEDCQAYASDTNASAGFWAADFRGEAPIVDLLDLLTELDDPEVPGYHEPPARPARYVRRRGLAS